MNKSLRSTILDDNEVEVWKSIVTKWDVEINKTNLSYLKKFRKRFKYANKALNEMVRLKLTSRLRAFRLMMRILGMLIKNHINQFTYKVEDWITSPFSIAFFMFGGFILWGYVAYRISQEVIWLILGAMS